MAAKQDKRQQLYSTEEVLGYLHIDSTSDKMTSEESEDDWQSSDSDSADRPVAKQPKLTTSTLAQDKWQVWGLYTYGRYQHRRACNS